MTPNPWPFLFTVTLSKALCWTLTLDNVHTQFSLLPTHKLPKQHWRELENSVNWVHFKFMVITKPILLLPHRSMSPCSLLIKPKAHSILPTAHDISSVLLKLQSYLDSNSISPLLSFSPSPPNCRTSLFFYLWLLYRLTSYLCLDPSELWSLRNLLICIVCLSPLMYPYGSCPLHAFS